MGEIYPLGQDCQYLLARAARHRRAGRYDQAMMLLSKARSLFGFREEIEFEIAGVYEEIGCDNEACLAYLRVARSGKKLSAQALFHLALSSAQRSDLSRAASYFEAFLLSDRAGITNEAVELLRRQLLDALKKKPERTKRQHAKALEERAIERLNAGKIHAAKRAVSRSLELHETPQGHVLKACCHLILNEGQDAVDCASAALKLRQRYLQAQCVLADAYIMTGEMEPARKTLIRAAFQANSSDALLSVAIETAKHGMDELTLILTKRLLKRESCHVRAMALHACALANLGCFRSARKLFARLCALVPDDFVFDSYYRTLHDGKSFDQRLVMAQDVTVSEALLRSEKLVITLNMDPAEVRSDPSRISEICRLAQWAMHSPMAGANVTLIAIIVLSVVNTQETREILFDSLIDPVLDDRLKSSILQALSAHSDQQPMYADLGGRFVRLAAGKTMPNVRGAADCQMVVQRASSALMRLYPEAPEVLLDIWAAYLMRFGVVRGKKADACACALEIMYHIRAGRTLDIDTVAARYGVTSRLARFFIRRLRRAVEKQENNVE